MIIILSELMIVLLTLIISIQSSSLLISLLTIPTSVILVNEMSADKSSGLIIFMFIMIFIGGLLVLLVSVTSTVYQEQGLSPSIFIFLLSLCLSLMFFTSMKSYDWNLTKATLFFWVNGLKINFLLFSVNMIVISLLAMSLLLMEFKGIIRKL